MLESLYVENKEAVFFDTSEELKKKVKYYLLNKEERNKIAKNGRERCLANKCSWHDRIVEIMYILKKEIL